MLYSAGTVLHNPVTTEWARLLSVGEDAVASELVTMPGGGVALMHRHPVQTEVFDVLAGELTVVLDGETHVFTPGATAVIEPGVAHCWTATGPEPLYARVTVTPPGRFAEMILAVWGLCATGRARPDGAPRALDAVLLTEAFGADMEPVSPPRWVQRVASGVAPLIRATGRHVDDPALFATAIVAPERWPGPVAARGEAIAG